MTWREQERNELPEHPSRMTYRGRYDHLDRRINELLGFSQLPLMTRIRVLDVGCGILHFGSPTLHDAWDNLVANGMDPVITGVDSHIPEQVSPSYPIQYVKDIKEAKGRFDIVRILRVMEHTSEDDYEALRKKALRRLRMGGLFIATQGLGRWKIDSVGPDLRWLPPVIKIAQKRRGGLCIVDLIPDAWVPWPIGFPVYGEDGLREYSEYREKVRAGTEEIPLELDEQGYHTFLSWLRRYPKEVLNHERVEWQADRGLLRRDKEGTWNEEEMHQTASTTASWFQKPGTHYLFERII